MLKKIGISVVVLLCLALVASASAKKVELSLLLTAGYAPEEIKSMKDNIKEFERLNPDVDIDLQEVDRDLWHSRLVQLHAVGQPPGLYFAEIEEAAVLFNQGLLDSVTPAAGQLGTYARGSRLVIDGEDYFYPLATTPDVLWYREDVFERKGVAVPTTWDEWRDAVEAATEDLDGDGKIDRWGMTVAMYRGTHVSHWWYNLFYGAGGRVMAETTLENLSPRHITLDSPATRKALEFGKMLFEHSPPGAINHKCGDMIKAVFSDKASMGMYEGRMLWWTIQRSPIPGLADNLKATWVPTPYGHPQPTVTCNDGMVVSSHLTPDQLKYAREFLDFLGSGDRLMHFLMGVPIHNLPVTTDPEVLARWREESVIAKYWDEVEVLLDSSKISISALNEWLTPNPVTAEVFTSWITADMVLEYIVENRPMDAVISNAVKDIEELIASTKERMGL